jgi:DNA-binding NarL/FixJ family response regulator
MSNPIRILVAEDHLVARVGVTTIVNMQPDMTVVAEASNGQQAIELYRKHLPDVTLLDLRMPGMGGVEAAQKIRAEFPGAHMIALTTYGGDEDIRRALAAGVQAYLTKDVLHDELLKAIRAVQSEYAQTRLPARFARPARAEDSFAAAAPARLRHHVRDPGHGPAKCCASRKARSIRRCTVWRKPAGFAPNGSPKTPAGGRASMN